MDTELVALFEAAKKAADAAVGQDDNGVSEKRCLHALTELKDFPVNYQILVSTQVGKRLRSLTKHPRKKIQSFAADLIEIWKNVIIQETSQKKNDTAGCNNSGKGENLSACNGKKDVSVKVEKVSRDQNFKVESVGKIVSPRPQKLAKTETGAVEMKIESKSIKNESPKSVGAVEVERTVVKQEDLGSSVRKPDGNAPLKLSSMIKTNDEMRDKTRELLLNALSKVATEADNSMKEMVDVCDPIRVAVSIESVMFDNWGRSNGPHKVKYRSIIFNLRDPKNPDFRRKVLTGDFKPEDICQLTTDDMASDERRQQKKQIEEKMLFDCERGGPPKATTDQFKCSKCGERKCTYYQLQTRSADEPMTTFVTCVNCNNHWKFC